MNFSSTTSPHPRSTHDARLTAINFVADAINRALDIREIASNALAAMTAITHMEAGAIYLWDPDEQVLKLHTAHGLATTLAAQLARIPRSAGGLVDAALAGQVQVVPDFTRIPQNEQAQLVAGAGFRSAILCRLSDQGTVAGMLVLASQAPQEFAGDDLGVIEVICNQLGNSLTHAKLESAIRKNEELYRLLVENSDDAIYITRADMRPRFANLAFERVFGYWSGELAVLDPYSLIQAADVTAVRQAHAQLLQGTPIHNLEYLFCRKDGHWVVLQCNAGVLARTNNAASEFQFVVRDVTESHQRQQQLIRRNAQLTALSTFAAVANTSLRLEDIVRGTLQVVLESAAMTVGSVHLLDASRQQLRLYRQLGMPEDLALAVRELKVGTGLAGTVALTGETSVFTEGPMTQFGLQTLVVVPLKTRGEVLGVLSLASPSIAPLEPDLIKMLTAMGHQLGSVIANIQLYESQLRENEKLTALLAISGGETQALELDSLLNRILQQAAVLLHADAAYLLHYHDSQIKVVAATDQLRNLIGTQFPATAEFAEQLQLTRQVRIFTREEISRDTTNPIVQQLNPQAILLVPLLARDHNLGALGLVRGTSDTSAFTTDELDLMSAFAVRAALAIDTAQLLHDLSEKNQQLELLIEEAHHRIKNNLQMVSGLLQLEAANNAVISPAIARIQAIAKVHNLLSREMPDKVNARPLITAILDSVISTAPIPPVLRLDLAPVWLSPDHATALALIVNELVANAAVHAHPRPDAGLQLQLHCRQTGDEVRLVVSDNGGGLPADFDWRQSTRQGMSIIRQLARTNLGGQIDFTNHNGGLSAELKFKNISTGRTLQA